MLYISTGDAEAPYPPDGLKTGQDISDLLASILRIDVDRLDPGLAYAVPPDNPFTTTLGARPEVWAYGFRNPWRMSFDSETGDLWVGDVGWDPTRFRLITREEKTLPMQGVKRFTEVPTSIMPAGLLQNLTSQEAADLLAYLASLR